MIIVDDGSTDGSAEIIKSYISKFEEKNFKLIYVYKKNRGQSAAINNALKYVNGEYLAWPDADDFYNSKKAISKMVKLLEKSDKNTSTVRVQYNVVNEQGKIIGRHGVNKSNKYKTDLFEDALFSENGFWFPPGGYLARMEKIDELITDREIYTEKEAGQNYQLYLPLFYNHDCITIEEFLYNIVEHADSHSRNQSTNNQRQKAYRRTIEATLNTMNLEKEYKNYLIKRVRKNARANLSDLQPNNIPIRTLTKRLVKGLMPHGIIVLLRQKNVLKNPHNIIYENSSVDEVEKNTLAQMGEYDNTIFERGFAQKDNMNKDNIDSWLLFCSHVLEKSMSRLNFEPGHNIFRLEQINNLLNEYDENGYDKSSFAYLYAISALKEYIDLHKLNSYSVDKIKDIIGFRYQEVITSKENIAGYKILKNTDKKDNKKINFKNIQQNRYSVREFSSKDVELGVIHKAIDLSTKSPSVCNRQPIRVHVIKNHEIIKNILKIQGGFDGYEYPNCLLLLTADTRSYVGENERNQGFIDGGVFAMSLLLSLEYYGLAACPLHAMFDPEKDRSVKERLNIIAPEYLIMFIAVGHFNKENKVAISSRRSTKSITKEYL